MFVDIADTRPPRPTWVHALVPGNPQGGFIVFKIGFFGKSGENVEPVFSRFIEFDPNVKLGKGIGLKIGGGQVRLAEKRT